MSVPIWNRPVCVICGANLAQGRYADRLPGFEILIADGWAGNTYHLVVQLNAARGCHGTTSYDEISQRAHVRFRMCGDGHMFFAGFHPGGAQPNYQGATESQIVATVGSPASGKSYLLARTLGQKLPVQPSISGRRVSVLEGAVFTSLKREYVHSVGKNDVLDPTGTLHEAPGTLWPDKLGAPVWQSIVELSGEADSELRGRWSRSLFQPLTRSYRLAGEDPRASARDVLLAVADLAGEHFQTGVSVLDALSELNLESKLSGFDMLVWTVDPAVCEAFRDWCDWADEKILGSLRPEADHTTLTELDRNENQTELAERLGGERAFNTEGGASQDLVVVITKADVFHEALQRDHKKLAGLGYRDDEVLDGIGRYLAYAAERDPATTEKLLGGHIVDKRISMLAKCLVEEYSRPDVFWSLVETGENLKLEIPGAADFHHPGWTLKIESADEHLRAMRRESSRFLPRETVMSALGCGLAYGLGFQQAVGELLSQRNRRVSFIVTSAMSAVPEAREQIGGERKYRVTLQAGDDGAPQRFPSTSTRSAGLTQLHAALLRRCM